jgi:hypothetical protein
MRLAARVGISYTEVPPVPSSASLLRPLRVPNQFPHRHIQTLADWLQRRELTILLAALTSPPRLHSRPKDLRGILHARVDPARRDRHNGARRHRRAVVIQNRAPNPRSDPAA